MKSLLLALGLVSTGAFADCDVHNYKDAIECIKADAYERYQEGEEEHSIGVTKFRKGKASFKKLTGKNATHTYVGVVQVHYDEDQVLYYEINKGKNVAPVLVKDMNQVDLFYYFPEMEKLKEAEVLKILSLNIPLKGSMEGFHF